jgi:hypothetical protein
MKVVVITLLLVGTVATASATVVDVPEIDASSAANALALLSGSLLLLKSRRNK